MLFDTGLSEPDRGRGWRRGPPLCTRIAVKISRDRVFPETRPALANGSTVNVQGSVRLKGSRSSSLELLLPISSPSRHHSDRGQRLTPGANARDLFQPGLITSHDKKAQLPGPTNRSSFAMPSRISNPSHGASPTVLRFPFSERNVSSQTSPVSSGSPRDTPP